MQHRIEEHASIVREVILEQNGVFLVAGNSKNMPAAVKEAVVKALYGDSDYVEQLVKTGRYQEETWAWIHFLRIIECSEMFLLCREIKNGPINVFCLSILKAPYSEISSISSAIFVFLIVTGVGQQILFRMPRHGECGRINCDVGNFLARRSITDVNDQVLTGRGQQSTIVTERNGSHRPIKSGEYSLWK